MAMQRLYNESGAKDQKVYAAWMRTTVALWALWGLALGVVVVLDVVNASMAPEQRIALLQQWVAW